MFENRVIRKQDIFKYVESLDVFKNYCPNFEIGKDINSPFRKDVNPSFGIIKGRWEEYIFKDIATGEHGDCIDFVQKLFVLTYFEALSKIATDFNLPVDEGFFYKDMSNIKTTVKEMSDEEREFLESLTKKSELRIKTRPYNQADADYWFSKGITYKVLQYYNVVAISHIFTADKIIVADKLAYAFIEMKDGKETYKIYQPFNKDLKWLSSHDASVWQGWTQLPEKGCDLIITKSLKDAMSIVSTLRIPAIAMQSENTKPKDEVLKELSRRFQFIYVLYDNDFNKDVNLGRMLGKELVKTISESGHDYVYQLEIPDGIGIKDYSECVERLGPDEAKKIINNQMMPF